jgi:exodeoxyribonuclease V beta subunit
MRRFDAVDVPFEGRALVEASAGTGKTYAITTLFVRLLLERRLAVDEILVVTFTEAATAELRGRIRRRLREALAVARALTSAPAAAAAVSLERADPELLRVLRARDTPARDAARLALALANVDEAAIETIHGFCHRTLRECAVMAGAPLDFELLQDPQLLRDELLYDYFSGTLADADPALVRLLRRERVTPSRCRALADALARSPDLTVLPPPPAQVAPLDRAAFDAAYDEAKQLYGRELIEQLLRDSDALKGNLYAARWLPGWLDELDALWHERPRPPALPDHFKKFCASSLAAACAKGKHGQQPEHAFFDACERLAEAHQHFGVAARDQLLSFRWRLVEYLRRELPARKHLAGVLSFDDLLQHTREALDKPAGAHLAQRIAQRYPAALIDEFQDTDPTQYAIFDRVWPREGLFLIGDPKQAIYSFRGADVFAYLSAAAEVAPERRFTMLTNWRSDPGVLRAIAALFEPHPRPLLLDAIGFPAVSARPGASDRLDADDGAGVAQAAAAFEVLFVPRDGARRVSRTEARTRLPARIASEIVELLTAQHTLAGEPLQPGDVAVLTRSNAQAFAVQGALRERGVPGVVLGDQSVFEDQQPEARELATVLAAVAEPTHSGRLRAALTTELLGVTATTLAEMDVAADEVDGRGEWDRWIERFRRWHEVWAGRGFVQMFRSLLDESGAHRRLLTLADGERRMTNLLHLGELLHSAASTGHLGPAGLLQWLDHQRSNAQQKVRPEANQIRLESDAHAVTITTVHRSKGLEYPIVYCPYLWDGLLIHRNERELQFHDPSDPRAVMLQLATGADDAEQRALVERERLAENLRLLYVALTRAKHRCVVTWGAFQDFETSPLGYLLHAAGCDDAQAAKSALQRLDDQALRAALDAWAERAGGALQWREVSLEASSQRWSPAVEAAPALSARRVAMPVRSGWRTASFSQLVAGGQARLDVREGRDRDEQLVEPVPAPTAVELPATVALADFPKGAKAGNFFHEVLEHIDFTAEPDDWRPVLERRLRIYGYPVERWREPLSTILSDVLATPLLVGKRAFALHDVPCSARLDELEFHLPVAGGSGDQPPARGAQLELLFDDARPAAGVVSAARLARVFAEHPSKMLDRDYVARVARLRFVPLEGFLKGYIDLVFQHEGRFYLVDYKTNHLGDEPAGYARARLPAVMAHSHYYLQYHLYALALHRHLERRQRGYRFAEHFGGVMYLFLRGMSCQRGAAYGVFAERPPRARIEALSELLQRPGGGRP